MQGRRRLDEDDDDDEDVTILRPPPVYRARRPAAGARCGPDELAAVALDEWPAPDGGAFDGPTAARIRQRVLEHVALHAQPTYRFLGMLEAASGGRLRMRDLVHVERGTLATAVRPGPGPPAESPPAPVGPERGPGGSGYSLDAVLQMVTTVLQGVVGNQAQIDELRTQLLTDLQQVRRALDRRPTTPSNIPSDVREWRDAYATLERDYDELDETYGEMKSMYTAEKKAVDEELKTTKEKLQEVQKKLNEMQSMREPEASVVPPTRRSLVDLADVLSNSRTPNEDAVLTPSSSVLPTYDLDYQTDEEQSADALIGGQLGARNRALRERVTVHLLLTPFALGLLELARDEVSEMADRGPRPLRLCALMHSFESGVASHFAKYAAQVWERQGAPPPLGAGADGSTVVQPRKTRYNYAAESALVTAARDYFSRLRVQADGTLAPAYHGRSLDVRALPDGVYAAHPELAASLPSYRRARIARTQLARDALGLGLAGGTVRRRARPAPAYAPYAPVRRVAAERTVGGSTGRFAPLRFAAPQWS